MCWESFQDPDGETEIVHQASTWAKPGSQNGLVRQTGWKVYALWEKGVLHPNVSWDLEPVFWILPCRLLGLKW